MKSEMYIQYSGVEFELVMHLFLHLPIYTRLGIDYVLCHERLLIIISRFLSI